VLAAIPAGSAERRVVVPDRGVPPVTTDEGVVARIERLLEEEDELRGGSATAGADTNRIEALEVELDRCWDLLRQRRAQRNAAVDPDAADLRDPATVETYDQ
jgi:hypothetical protein